MEIMLPGFSRIQPRLLWMPIEMRIDSDAIGRLVEGKVDVIGGGGSIVKVVFPGSFNPRHDGHHQMAGIAAKRLGEPVYYEISIQNVDKPALGSATIRKRLQQFDASENVLLTRTPLFDQKANLFRDATFIVGADTVIRLDDAKYYQGDIALRDQSIERLHSLGASFLVFGRLIDRKFESAKTISLSPSLRSLCQFVPETEFRIDLQSRDLRESTRRL